MSICEYNWKGAKYTACVRTVTFTWIFVKISLLHNGNAVITVSRAHMQYQIVKNHSWKTKWHCVTWKMLHATFLKTYDVLWVVLYRKNATNCSVEHFEQFCTASMEILMPGEVVYFEIVVWGTLNPCKQCEQELWMKILILGQVGKFKTRQPFNILQYDFMPMCD